MTGLKKILMGAAIAVTGLVILMGTVVMTSGFSPRAFAEGECDGVKTSVLGENGCVEGTDDGSAIKCGADDFDIWRGNCWYDWNCDCGYTIYDCER